MTHDEAARLHEAAALAQCPEATDAAWSATNQLMNGPEPGFTNAEFQATDAVNHARHNRWEQAAECHGLAAQQHRNMETFVSASVKTPAEIRAQLERLQKQEDDI